MERKKRYWILSGVLIVMIMLNILAWKSPALCDFYVDNIYPLWVNTYSRAMSLFSFSVGEIMLGIGAVLTAAGLLMAVCAGIFFLYKKVYRGLFIDQEREARENNRIKNIIKKIYGIYFEVYAWIFAGVAVVMTLNCFIPYHCSTLEEKYGILCKKTEDSFLVEEILSKEYTLEELIRLRDYVVIKANELAGQVERDENGNIVYPDNMESVAEESMRSLSKDCPQLAGYYPQPKQFTFSGFFSQQKMKGYFFPFSMEVNYNKLMHEINRPATICHEYAHLKGFMYEEEANMIGFLACINSPDVSFQYSGYLSVLNYIDNEFYKAIGKNREVYLSHVKISPQVKAENIFLDDKMWRKVEEKAVIKTEVVDRVSDKLSETSMVLNGVEDGILSYTRVVGLLLHYYDGSMEVEEVLLRSQELPAETEIAKGE